MSNVLLVILDGWGHSDFDDPPWEGNAPEQARVPRFRALYDHAPRTRLACSGFDVGLPEGQMGNSEVGHLNLGAGRIVYQDIARVDKSIADGEFAGALGLDDTVARLRVNGGALHLVGLVSDGGVHSHIPFTGSGSGWPVYSTRQTTLSFLSLNSMWTSLRVCGFALMLRNSKRSKCPGRFQTGSPAGNWFPLI